MSENIESRLDRAYEMANLDRHKYGKASYLFKTVLKIIDQVKENDEDFKWAFEEIGELVKKTQAGKWHGEIAT